MVGMIISQKRFILTFNTEEPYFSTSMSSSKESSSSSQVSWEYKNQIAKMSF